MSEAARLEEPSLYYVRELHDDYVFFENAVPDILDRTLTTHRTSRIMISNFLFGAEVHIAKSKLSGCYFSGWSLYHTWLEEIASMAAVPKCHAKRYPQGKKCEDSDGPPSYHEALVDPEYGAVEEQEAELYAVQTKEPNK